MTLVDQLKIKNQQLYFEDVFGTQYPLPNLTALWQLYHETTNTTIKKHIAAIFSEDLGTLLVVEIMIDATHEVTLKRLETGEISKNMKHVHDYYIIPKSHYALAQTQFEANPANVDRPFTSCHFAMFPYGLAIIKAAFPEYTNPYTQISTTLL